MVWTSVRGGGAAIIEGVIFDIQRYSLNDGPGIRTIVFMKGCPLRCRWCCNPESQRYGPEIFVDSRKCIGCGKCLEVCPEGALGLRGCNVVLDRRACSGCGKCVEVCYPEALRFAGRLVTISKLLEEIEKDRAFYRDSGGGITVSGGESLYQVAFVEEFLKQCRQIGIHTAIETSGFAAWADFSKVLKYTDLVLYDLKQMDPTKHRNYTGKSNEVILQNARRLATEQVIMEMRLPLIPGYNDSRDHIEAALKFTADLEVVSTIAILPFHRLATAKYRMLGRKYRLASTKQPDSATIQVWSELVRSAGFTVKIGG